LSPSAPSDTSTSHTEELFTIRAKSSSTSSSRQVTRPGLGLAHVTGLRFGHFYAANVTTYYPAEPITVTFPDAEITIPGPNFPVEQRPAADRFLTALRAGVDLATNSSTSAPS
jgi:hypothetical protein